MTLLIHAPNVHQGGGRTLLLAVLECARTRSDVAAVVDARLSLPPDFPESLIAARIRPGVGSRLAAEWRLRTSLTAEDVVLCFGNLPPLFGTPARVVLFLQNRYLVRRRDMNGLPLRTRVRNQVERFWVRARVGGTQRVVVQTQSMAEEVKEELGVAPVIAPFVAESARRTSNGEAADAQRDLDFLYVASGQPHKNHNNLIAAWRVLAQDGLRPSLGLTLSADDYPELCAEIESARTRDDLRIQNVGLVSASTVDALYARARAVIYPSRFESFGLPLVDAAAKGLPIVAAELDYVRDVVQPEQTFDPNSPVSIARAVRRFCGYAEDPQRILTPAEFLDRVCAEARTQRARR